MALGLALGACPCAGRRIGNARTGPVRACPLSVLSPRRKYPPLLSFTPVHAPWGRPKRCTAHHKLLIHLPLLFFFAVSFCTREQRAMANGADPLDRHHPTPPRQQSPLVWGAACGPRPLRHTGSRVAARRPPCPSPHTPPSRRAAAHGAAPGGGAGRRAARRASRGASAPPTAGVCHRRGTRRAGLVAPPPPSPPSLLLSPPPPASRCIMHGGGGPWRDITEARAVTPAVDGGGPLTPAGMRNSFLQAHAHAWMARAHACRG